MKNFSPNTTGSVIPGWPRRAEQGVRLSSRLPANPKFVMPGLVPGIDVLSDRTTQGTWMAGKPRLWRAAGGGGIVQTHLARADDRDRHRACVSASRAGPNHPRCAARIGQSVVARRMAGLRRHLRRCALFAADAEQPR